MKGRTVGPWRAWGHMVLSPTQDGDEVVVAERITLKDDATFIASAPDLLEALKEAREFIAKSTIEDFDGWPVIMARIDSAIAAATGEPSP